MSFVSVILCRPQLDLNVGACARVMSNMDYHDLRIVRPRDKDILKNAYASASHAADILDNAKVFDTIEDAISDLSFVAMTSARPRDIEKRHCYLNDFPDVLKNSPDKIGIVFGAERTGLTNQELALADIIIEIETGIKNQSYNLSHAVAIVLHKIFNTEKITNQSTDEKFATKNEINHFFEYLLSILDETYYFKDSNKQMGQSLNIKNIFTKDYLSSQDVKTLFGIVKHLKSQPKIQK